MSDGKERASRSTGGADSEADRAEDEGVDELHPADEPEDELGPADEGTYDESDGEANGENGEGAGDEPTDQDKWRTVAWVAVIAAIVGVGWALILSTILLNRSGDRTAELISLFESGQETRESSQEALVAALAGIPQSQAERRATVKGLQEQSQLFRAQTLAALADQSEGNANAREAVASAALANAQQRQASSETLVLAALTAQAEAIANLQSSIDQLRTNLTSALKKLRESIKDLGPRP